ncbi:hypothetical protein [Mycobacterium sp. DL592]|uniref:hypothetical protein n=1 Tax=Mycobacterium sp. DL592 TaxID=2675524 RepID=UPI00141F7962|nr:hypothetical protein [Mycobacterium sp. DL592]
MGTTRAVRRSLAAVSIGLGVGAGVIRMAPATSLAEHCPAGQAAVDADRWQCVHECPAGMIYDGDSDVCVAAPGVPPPALSPQIPQAPQIPQL